MPKYHHVDVYGIKSPMHSPTLLGQQAKIAKKGKVMQLPQAGDTCQFFPHT
jgi:hypothetical protein